jgi:hypothetical protein
VIGVLFSAENNDPHGRERFCRIACWKSTEVIVEQKMGCKHRWLLKAVLDEPSRDQSLVEKAKAS